MKALQKLTFVVLATAMSTLIPLGVGAAGASLAGAGRSEVQPTAGAGKPVVATRTVVKTPTNPTGEIVVTSQNTGPDALPAGVATSQGVEPDSGSCTYPSFCDGGRTPGCDTITESATYDTTGIVMWGYHQHTTYCWNDVKVTSHDTWETATLTESGQVLGWAYTGKVSTTFECFTGGDGVSCSGNYEFSEGEFSWDVGVHDFHVYPTITQWERYAGGYSQEYGG
jgi:hypothetical protein